VCGPPLKKLGCVTVGFGDAFVPRLEYPIIFTVAPSLMIEDMQVDEPVSSLRRQNALAGLDATPYECLGLAWRVNL